MNKDQLKKIVLRVVVTFIEAGLAVWAAAGFKLDKVVLGAVVGAGLSAVYNLSKHYISQ